MSTALALLIACWPPPEDCDLTRVFTDGDGDGYGNTATARRVCEVLPGQVEQGGDFDDNDPDVHPNAREECDGIDEDGDGLVDEDAIDATIWYLDGDGDGDGDPNASEVACTPSDCCEWSLNDADCDDDDWETHPGAIEVCDGVDQDCNGVIDDDCTPP